MPVGDYFRKLFGGPYRKETDMGDGSHAERFIAVPPANMTSGDRLQVALDEPIDVTLPAALITGDRVRVTVDDPIDVVLPAALVNANRVKVEVDDPIDVNLPQALITGGGIAGNSPRLRVDSGQTGFFAGRMFRAFLEGVIPTAGPSVQFRFTAPVNFILWTQSLVLTQGALQLEIYTGATPSGTWTPITPIGLNRMSERPTPFYTPVCTIETGGNFTGGTRTDVLKIRASSANNSASNVGGEWSERGLPAAVFYGRLSTLPGGLAVNDAAQYVYSLGWEERP